MWGLLRLSSRSFYSSQLFFLRKTCEETEFSSQSDNISVILTSHFSSLDCSVSSVITSLHLLSSTSSKTFMWRIQCTSLPLSYITLPQFSKCSATLLPWFLWLLCFFCLPLFLFSHWLLFFHTFFTGSSSVWPKAHTDVYLYWSTPSVSGRL